MSRPALTEQAYLEGIRIATRPALVSACARATLAVLLGLALVLAVWKDLSLTASALATGGLVLCSRRRE
jgi:hypothetical protein